MPRVLAVIAAFAVVACAHAGEAGLVVSKKTGATAHVAARYAAKFQAYVDDLEAGGAVVRFMGGIRRGHCWAGSLHPCGMALDVCQLARGRVDWRCHLPSRHAVAQMASAHGLFEGGQWCSSDYGHVQVGETSAPCGKKDMAAWPRTVAMTHRHRIARLMPSPEPGWNTDLR